MEAKDHVIILGRLTVSSEQGGRTPPKGERRIGTEAGNIKISVRKLVLHEAAYKCLSPRCRYPLTLEIHHLYYVSKGGSDDPANLLPLCPTCHQEHHVGKIPTDSLVAWK